MSKHMEVLKSGVLKSGVLKSGTTGLKSKFDKTDCNTAEHIVYGYTKSVYNCLKDYASDKKFTDIDKWTVFGDKFYRHIRNLLYEFKHGPLVEQQLPNIPEQKT